MKPSPSPSKPTFMNDTLSPKETSTKSPFRIFKESTANQEMPQEIKSVATKMMALFLYYTSYGDKMNLNLMRSSNFHRLLVDAGIEKNEKDKIDFDILYKKYTKNSNNLSFKDFLDILVPISRKLLPSKNSNECADELMNSYLLKLMQSKEKEISVSSLSSLIKSTDIPEHVYLLFASIESMLFDIYQFYFPHEKSSPATPEELCIVSTTAALEFIYEFDICPAVISRPQAYFLLHSIVDKDVALIKVKPKHNIGKLFTFPKFVEYLLLCGVHSHGFSTNNLFGKLVNRKTSFLP